MRSPITTHILDTHLGKPAQHVPIQLKQLQDGMFVEIASGSTDDDGRISDLLPLERLRLGVYQMRDLIQRLTIRLWESKASIQRLWSLLKSKRPMSIITSHCY